ncbi:flavodoxin [Bifidobacterium eulemuris]|uniref:Flavodoxin n=1 Tax=Bifidobacterium eulemuris TaxID=1765219 RepID=A0A261GDB4_9BIFI|nr:flavodoxin [Bifidobacterium eulemuris]OZG69432.1 flavodoxin [Bifidobacterium eulemuris]QOL31092.1 flavodoxin [Bifidobacterium eulemuris]
MKKIAAAAMSIVLAASLAACGGTSQSDAQDSDTSQSDLSMTTDTPTTSGDGSTLVVYYSAQGHTEEVANVVADAAGADVFVITPSEPYTDDDLNWTNDNSRVSIEHDNPDQRDVELTTTDVPNWDSYDTVFIGYPIWWAVAAWPVNGFVEANDFTGKTVIPFCTSTSSGLGSSATQLAELTGTGDWQEGQRFSSNASESDVQNWVASLNL